MHLLKSIVGKKLFPVKIERHKNNDKEVDDEG